MGLYLVVGGGLTAVYLIFLILRSGGIPNMNDLLNDPIALLLDQTGMGIAAILGCLLVRYRNKTSLKARFAVKGFDPSVPLMLLIFGYSGAELLDHLSGLVLSNFMTVEPNRDVPPGLVGIWMAVVGAPIIEELIFRYAAIEFPRGAYPVWVICLCNGFFFAIVHMYNVQGFLNIFVGGIATAYIYCKTRNLWYVMLQHAAHNALCFLPFERWNIYYEKNGFVLGNGWWIALHAVLTAVVIVWYFLYFRKKYAADDFAVNPETGMPEPERTKPTAQN